MALMDNYAETCRSRATNPEWPLDLLKSIEGEFRKGIECGFMDPHYILSKLEALKKHTEWCAEVANEQFAEQCD